MGRKPTVNVKENRHYFAEYYHKTNKEHVCECGCKYLLHSKRRHMLSKKHIEIMEILKLRAEADELNSNIFRAKIEL